MEFLYALSCSNVSHVLRRATGADVSTLLYQFWHGLQPLLESEDLLEVDHAMGAHHILDASAA